MNTDQPTLVYQFRPFSDVSVRHVNLVLNRDRFKRTYHCGNSFPRTASIFNTIVPLPACDLVGWLDVLSDKPPYPLMGKNHSRVIDGHNALRDLYKNIVLPEGCDHPESDTYTSPHGDKYIHNPYYNATITLNALEKLGHAVPYKYYKITHHYVSVVAYVAITQMPLELLKYFKFIAA